MDLTKQIKPLEVNIHWIKPQSVDLSLTTLLSEPERLKARQFLFDSDRELYQAAHIFLRSILSRYSGIVADKLQFSVNEFGKPSLVSDKNICFNLSHTTGMIVCGISDGIDIGVDVENYTRPLDIGSILKSSYSEFEAGNVEQQNNKIKRQQLFYTYWTLKESYIKGVGEGLTIPLNQCEFRKMSAQKWKLSDVAQNQLEKANWKFYSCLLGDEWVFSAAQDGNLLSTEQDLIVRIIDPNSDDNFREQ